MSSSVQQATLIRLARCTRWVEEYRVQKYVGLLGYIASGRFVRELFDLSELSELQQAGEVEVEESQRFAPVNSDGKLGAVTERSWKVKA